MAHLSRGRHKSLKKPELPKVFIFTEGYTEWYYFNGFKLKSRGSGIIIKTPEPKKSRSGCKLVEETIKRLEPMGREPGDLVYVVFDRDSNAGDSKAWQRNYAQALKLASQNNIEIILSNDAFELWYLLHYRDVKDPMSRDRMGELLNKLVVGGYKKPAPEMFNILLNDKLKIKQALKRAKRLSCPDNPSCDIYKLVNFLVNALNIDINLKNK